MEKRRVHTILLIDPYVDFSAYLQTAENPEMRFVISNTTEAGITYNESDKPTDAPPTSFPGKLTVWLNHRYKTFNGEEA
jgi:tagaturonate reductase